MPQFHPKTNIEKMHKGIPLTDADRAAWLQAIEEHALVHPEGAPEHQPLVVTCSALKHEYRQTLRDGSRRADDVRIGFLFLDAPEAVLRERAQKRKGHFAGANLVHSQFEILEKPVGEEGVVIVNVNQSMDEAEREALEAVRRMIGI
jgi:gluconokinase